MTKMTRVISKSMSPILEELELKAETYVTSKYIGELIHKYGIGTDVTMVAQRLKKAGWLLPTDQRGVWEYAPAAAAGAYSKNDPLRDIIAFDLANPDIKSFLCMQTAAWALGLADRIPTKKELAFDEIPRRHISENILTYKYSPKLETREIRGVRCLAPESIIVHLASKPEKVKNWESVTEWLPDVVFESEIINFLTELSDRTDSVKKRTGYLLQGMFPEAARAIRDTTIITSKIRFGARKPAIRNDEYWKVADTLLPFSPKELERVK